MLVTKGLSYSYNDKDWIDFPDVNCASDAPYLVLGQSGKGKTTFLHLIAGLLKSKKGSIEIQNTDLSKLSDSQLDKYRGENIGIIFQQSHFINALDVEENLMLTQKLAAKPINKKDIKDILDKLNIGHKLKSKTINLSQGEKQRVAIARALINKPVLILADEPTSALDDTNCDEVVKLLESTADDVDATLIIVTHDSRLMTHFPNQIRLA